jgi:hypothetical protein
LFHNFCHARLLQGVKLVPYAAGSGGFGTKGSGSSAQRSGGDKPDPRKLSKASVAAVVAPPGPLYGCQRVQQPRHAPGGWRPCLPPATAHASPIPPPPLCLLQSALERELSKRGLSTDGGKLKLAERLQAALAAESGAAAQPGPAGSGQEQGAATAAAEPAVQQTEAAAGQSKVESEVQPEVEPGPQQREAQAEPPEQAEVAGGQSAAAQGAGAPAAAADGRAPAADAKAGRSRPEAGQEAPAAEKLEAGAPAAASAPPGGAAEAPAEADAAAAPASEQPSLDDLAAKTKASAASLRSCAGPRRPRCRSSCAGN